MRNLTKVAKDMLKHVPDGAKHNYLRGTIEEIIWNSENLPPELHDWKDAHEKLDNALMLNTNEWSYKIMKIWLDRDDLY
jgi:hypothetical protein